MKRNLYSKMNELNLVHKLHMFNHKHNIKVKFMTKIKKNWSLLHIELRMLSVSLNQGVKLQVEELDGCTQWSPIFVTA